MEKNDLVLIAHDDMAWLFNLQPKKILKQKDNFHAVVKSIGEESIGGWAEIQLLDLTGNPLFIVDKFGNTKSGTMLSPGDQDKIKVANTTASAPWRAAWAVWKGKQLVLDQEQELNQALDAKKRDKLIGLIANKYNLEVPFLLNIIEDLQDTGVCDAGL